MKKFIILLAAVIMAFSFAGCGEYKAPVGTGPGQIGPDNPPVITDPEDPDKDGVFTVSLIYSDAAFSPAEQIYAYWNELDGGRIYRAEFNEEGVAKISGLDGDYRITLSALPDGYTYDPNSDKYIATNDNKNISITLYELRSTSGTGSDLYNDIISLSQLGAYRATLKSPAQKIYFQYIPLAAGEYSMTSLIDVTANVINPILDIYIGNTQFKAFSETRDGGGVENTFTKNFKWEMRLSKSEVGNIFAFCIRTETLSEDAYPVNIDFILDKDGEYTGTTETVYVPVPVTEDFKQTPEYTTEFQYIAYENPQLKLDESLVKLNPDDGYYHLYDDVTGEYGPILYAKITQATEVISEAFTFDLVNKRVNGKDYNNLINSYAQYVNKKDGVYAVTEELKTFILDYANSQLLFNDGNGLAEVPYGSFRGYSSTLSAQWLFACGYYPE